MTTHKPKKKFGQNFLVDKNLTHKIIDAFNPKPEEYILEIGPGLGALTDIIKSRINNTVLNLVEVDTELADKLINKYQDEIKLFNVDILKFDLNNILTNTSKQSLRIIGNLPYNISTPILFHLFEYIYSIKDMMFMLQLEVVDRITAKPNTKQYGRLSVMTQALCDCSKVLHIPATAFNPKPKVESAIVYLKPKSEDIINKLNLELLNKIVTAAFNQRRKTISNSLKDIIKTKELESLGIDSKQRAECLSLEQFINIHDYLLTT